VTPADGSAGFVTSHFGVVLHAGHGEPLGDLVRLALRRNPKRAHLLVSTVLGKHIPTDPRIVHDAGIRLGSAVSARLDDRPALVIGYAETATGLGHCVAEALGADCLHSTRRQPTVVRPLAGFEEAHSHATGHLLVPEDVRLVTRPGPIVLVDDELSTGATALNTIGALQRLYRRERYVVAALVDVRTAADRQRFTRAAVELGTDIEVVSLGSGTVELPADLATRAAEFVASAPVDTGEQLRGTASLIDVPQAWPASVRDGGRHGFTAADQVAAVAAAAAQAQLVEPIGPRVLVLGTEELMYAPLLIALGLADRPRLDVRYSTTTRSPVLALDEPDYPIRSRLAFPTAEGERFAYNVAGTGFDDVVVVADSPDVAGLADAVRGACERVHVVRLPAYQPLPPPLRGPEFGSYGADEVTWLLTDLSDVPLEAPVEEREEAVQSGGAHYAESLPIEYQPSAEYQELFEAALDETAARLAHAVGVVTELVLDRRGPDAVLVSLARAGTPIGILMRRWAAWRHGLDLPHYAVSIVRGRGIDATALRYLAAHHQAEQIMFVDGWTGKGAIVRELASAVEQADPRFSTELAVLADTGSCTSLYGTREDYLIPSACLNSTVSGLVSRTVLNDRVLASGQYHGAKFYKELAPADVSGVFLDRVSAEFGAVADQVAGTWPVLRDSDRTPTWAGWAAVEAISERWDIRDVNLVKPGVGETTRVLLRRVPWRVLVRPGSESEVQHVLLLADQRGVPVERVPGLAYRCVGLIHPAYTRGATGAVGRSAVS
jgi:adenine/guanine phosphoribosyltransferase-like PRPP-binding protein